MVSDRWTRWRALVHTASRFSVELSRRSRLALGAPARPPTVASIPFCLIGRALNVPGLRPRQDGSSAGHHANRLHRRNFTGTKVAQYCRRAIMSP